MHSNQDIAPLLPRMSVGVMGSAGGKLEDKARHLVRQLGRTIASRGYILITGACPGLPHEAVKDFKLNPPLVKCPGLSEAKSQ